jgi:hypothetical protein
MVTQVFLGPDDCFAVKIHPLKVQAGYTGLRRMHQITGTYDLFIVKDRVISGLEFNGGEFSGVYGRRRKIVRQEHTPQQLIIDRVIKIWIPGIGVTRRVCSGAVDDGDVWELGPVDVDAPRRKGHIFHFAVVIDFVGLLVLGVRNSDLVVEKLVRRPAHLFGVVVIGHIRPAA